MSHTAKRLIIITTLFICTQFFTTKTIAAAPEKTDSTIIHETALSFTLDTNDTNLPATITYERITARADFSQERKLFVDAFANTYKNDPEPFEKLGIYDISGYFAREFNKEFYKFAQAFYTSSPIYVIRARIGNTVVGFVFFNKEKTAGQVYIRWLAVSPAYGKHGIGRELGSIYI